MFSDPVSSRQTFSVHTGIQAYLMGSYKPSATRLVNGAPLYVKALVGGGAHYLYRGNGNREGKWLVTADERSIAQNRGAILSSQKADTPSAAGLSWLYSGASSSGASSAWRDDPNLTCVEASNIGSMGRRQAAPRPTA